MQMTMRLKDFVRLSQGVHHFSGAQRWAMKKLWVAGESGMSGDDLDKAAIQMRTLDVLEKLELIEWVAFRCCLTEKGRAQFVPNGARAS